ncbi:hypothetical protein [Aquibacillus saliphilus]|uniref:hypothetical protein n=1 Tax=Aquibacillus saliphilus TaxID=1909422 RepID=UPI003F72EDE8
MSEGKKFEEDLEKSANKQNIFCFRVRDVNPMLLKKGAKTAKNKYDFLVYHKLYLVPMELKSVKAKSISFDESMIKDYQIKSLTEASTYRGVIAGFLFNFRIEDEPKTYFIHINDFNAYKNIAENQLEHNYKSKVNRSSIPIGICEEIGIEVKWRKPISRYTYYLNDLFNELTEKYG